MYMGILIDPPTQSVQRVSLKDIHDVYTRLGCTMVEIGAFNRLSGDILLVDEEGRIVPKNLGTFVFNGNPFFGRGMLVGTKEDEWVDHRTSIETVFHLISFPNGE